MFMHRVTTIELLRSTYFVAYFAMIRGIIITMIHKNDKVNGFSDIDECKGNHSCHVNATCTNTKGSYACTCHPGYTENGGDCKGT